MDVVTVTLAGLLLVIITCWWLANNASTMPDIPGPKTWPIVGNILQMGGRIDLTTAEWSKQLGGVVKVKAFGKYFLVLSSYEAIYEALVKKTNDFAGRPHAKSFKAKFAAADRGLAFSNPNEVWYVLRKCCQRELKMFDNGLKKIEDISIHILKDLVKALRSYDGKPVDPWIPCRHAVLNTICLLTIGKKFSLEDEEFQMFNEMEIAAAKATSPNLDSIILNIFPIVRFFGNKTFKEMKYFVETRSKLYDMVKQQIEKESADRPEIEQTGALTALLKLLKDPNTGLDDLDVLTAFTGLIVAGTGTTSRVLHTFLNVVHQYPEVQAALQAEVDEVVGDSRSVSLKDKANMPYTYATVLELLRYTSVTPLSLPHRTQCQTSVEGKAVPMDTEVMINIWALHHDEDFWQDPYTFRPSRFLEEDGTLVSASHPNRKHLMPFGAGLRVCLGEVLALNRLFLFVSTLSQVFTVKAGPEKVTCDPRHFPSSVVLRNPDYQVSLINRNHNLYYD